MKSFSRSAPAIIRRLGRARRLLLVLDFDGTLAPIVGDPERARIEPELLRALRKVVHRPRTRVAIISGRSLRDLRGKLRLPGAVLLGNHGLEAAAGVLGDHPEVRRARKLIPVLDIFYRKLGTTVGRWSGVRVEHKKWTITVHYRGLPSERRLLLERMLVFYRDRLSAYPVRWRRGKQVIEVRPDVRWDKGRAADRLYRSWRADDALVCGDDRTDEDMFKALRGRAVTVRVGRAHSGAAAYRAESPAELRSVLEGLC